jgi:CheY-like chemotaxis protein
LKTLIVEDAADVLDELRRTVQPAFDLGEIVLAESRDEALERLEAEVFDLIILDRKLPTSNGALDDDVAHGEAVYEYIKEFVIGTPVRFWTAYSEDEYIGEKIDSDVRKEDIWGTGKQYATVGIISKSRFDHVIALCREVKECVRALTLIEIRQPPGRQVDLSKEERAVLRIFARRQGGTAIEAQELSGGLSGAKVLRAIVFDGARRLAQAVVKLGPIPLVEDEHQRQRRVLLLPAGAATQVMAMVRAGAGPVGGVFYRLADAYDASIFDVLRRAPDVGEDVVARLRELVAPWTQAARTATATVREYRRRFATDAVFGTLRDALPDLRLDEFETSRFVFQVCCCHGDLHCGNVLVDAAHRPILIDYGEVDEHPAALDPITLELSAVFRMQRTPEVAQWFSLQQASKWCNLEEYLVGCPIAKFVAACRNWAYAAATGNRAMYVVAYCYLMRQLKYPDIDQELVKAVIVAVVTEYANT